MVRFATPTRIECPRARSVRSLRLGLALCTLACAHLVVPLFAQTTGTWINTAGTTTGWGTAANWSGGTIPNGTGHVANLTADLTGAQTITLDGDRTVGTLNLGDSAGTPFSYSISQGSFGTLIFAASSGNATLTQGAGSAANTLFAPLQLRANLDLANHAGTSLTLANTISEFGGAYGINKSGTGTVILTGHNSSFSGTTTISGGTLQIGSGGSSGSFGTGPIVLAGGTLAITGGGGSPVTLPLISGDGTLTANSGTFPAASTYSGTTNLQFGFFRVHHDQAFGSSLVNLTNATLQSQTAVPRTLANDFNLNGNTSFSNADFTLTGNVTLTGHRTLGIAAATTVTLARGLAESTPSNLTIAANNGSFILNATPGYTGTTTLTSGALHLGAGVSLPTANLLLSGGVLGTQGTFARPLGTGAGEVRWTFNGGFAAYDGNLSVGFSGSEVWGSTANFLPAGAILKFGATSATGVVTWTSNFSLGSATRTIHVDDNPATTADAAVISGVISGASGAGLAKNGTGQLTLTGTNTFDGPVALNGGTLSASSFAGAGSGPGPLGAPTTTANATITLNNGTLDYSGPGETNARLLHLAGHGGLSASGTGPLIHQSALTSVAGAKTFTLTGTSTAANEFRAVLADNSGALSLTKSGTGTWRLTAANTYTGTTTVTGGLLQLVGAGTLGANTGTLVLAGGTLDLGAKSQSAAAATFSGGNLTNGTLTATSYAATGNGTISAILAGTGSFTKTGAGTTTTLTAANTYTGTTSINSGTLNISANNNLGPASDPTLNGGTLQFGAAFTLARNLTLGAASAIDTNGFNATFSGVLSGAGGLTKSGAGTLTLNGANTYTGATTVSGGTLLLGSSGTLGAAGGAIDLAGGTLDLGARSLSVGAATFSGGNLANGTLTATSYSATGNSTIGAILAGSGAFTKTGAGTTTILTAANTFTSNPTLTSGTLNVNAENRLGAGSAVLFNGGTLQLGASFPLTRSLTLNAPGGTIDTNGFNATLSSAVSGAGAFTKAGAGTLTLSTAPTHTGGTVVNGGTLLLAVPASSLALGGATSPLAVQGGTFDLGGKTVFVTTATLSGGQLTNGTLNAQSYSATGAGTVSATLAGSATLTKSGPNTFTLSGTSTYTGATRVTAGTLQFTRPSALYNGNTGSWFASNVIVQSGATAAFSVGGAGEFTSFQIDTLKALGTATGGFLSGAFLGLDTTNASGGTFPYSSNIANPNSGANALGLVKLGSGTLSLTGANTYTGGTLVSGGTLLGTSSSLPGSIVNHANVTFQQNSSGTYAGAMSGTGSLTKTGTGQLTLSGANPHTGGTTVSAGTLILGASDRLADTGPLTVSGGTFQLGAFSETVGAVTLASGSIPGTGTLTASSFDVRSGTISAPLAGSAALTKSTAGFVTLSGANTYTGGTIISGGQLSGTTTSLQGEIVNNAFLTFNQATAGTFAGTISGTGSLTKSGTGTVTLTGANTYTGTTTVFAGILALGASDRLADTGPLTINSGGTFDLGAFNETLGAVTLTSGSISGTGTLIASSYDVRSGTIAAPLAGSAALTKSTASTVTLSGANTYTGATTLNGGILSVAANGNLGAAAANLVFGGGTLRATDTFTATRATSLNAGGGTFDVTTGQTLTWNGAITGAAGNHLTKTGDGVLVFGGANTYSGDTSVHAGTLTLAHADALNPNTRLHVAPGATFQANGYAPTVGELSGTGTFDLGSAGLTLSHTGTQSFSGTLTGAGGFTKSGTGTLTLGGINTHTGPTQVSAGHLKITGSISGSAVDIGPGATLSGDGTIGPLTVRGNVSPGASPGTLFTGAETWNGGGSYTWEINHPTGIIGTNTDLLSISGTLDIAATSASKFTLSLVSLTNGNATGLLEGFNSVQNYSYTIASTTGGILNFDTSKFTLDTSGFQNALNGGTWSLTLGNGGQNLDLNFTASAIPEPGTYAAFAGAGALGLAIWRKRRRAKRRMPAAPLDQPATQEPAKRPS